MTEPLYLVYDGECPLCQFGVRHLRIRKAAGELVLLDARTEGDHPILKEIAVRGMSVDQGMVAHYQGRFYQGEDALHLLSFLGTDHDWLNRLNARLFRSKAICRLTYPFMRAGRNLALRIKGVSPLNVQV